jgi:acetoin utilization protein AcuC
MATQARVIWDDSFTRYDFGPSHPMAPLRLDLTARLARALGLFDDPDRVEVVGAQPASDELLETVHDRAYVAAVKAASADPAAAQAERGLGTEDDPAFLGMHEASARVVQGSVDLASAIWRGEIEHGVNFCGGLHHALADRASGFCVYNDVAAAIRRLLDEGAERVAYVDVDVHHGDGVQAIFYEDPRVLTVSIHQSGATLFPGTGFVDERGAGAAEGTKVNVPLEPGAGDRAWLAAFAEIVPPVVRAFGAEVLVTQLGCDTHRTDPLAQLRLSTAAYRDTAASLHALAHEVTGGRWLATGGGGYQWATVVPRAWTLAFAEMSDAELPDALPEPWIEQVELEIGGEVPATFSEPPLERDELDGRTERTIEEVKRTCFPFFGLRP